MANIGFSDLESLHAKNLPSGQIGAKFEPNRSRNKGFQNFEGCARVRQKMTSKLHSGVILIPFFAILERAYQVLLVHQVFPR